MRQKQTKDEAVYRYYLLGLTFKEIGKLTDQSEKTIQRLAKAGKFKERSTPQPMAEKVREMRKQGYSYTSIAKALKCCKTTVYNYLKKRPQPLVE